MAASCRISYPRGVRPSVGARPPRTRPQATFLLASSASPGAQARAMVATWAPSGWRKRAGLVSSPTAGKAGRTPLWRRRLISASLAMVRPRWRTSLTARARPLYASQRGAAPHTNFFSEYPAQPLAAIRQHHRLLHRLSHVDPSLTTRSGSLALLEKHHETRQHSGRNPPQVCARFELYNAVSVQGASPSAPYVAPCTPCSAPFSVPALASH